MEWWRQDIQDGIARVDIMFDNPFKKGFFYDAASRLNVPCYHVPIECKNYTDDLKTPEYDQLSGRMNDDIGRIGILVFRHVHDKEKLHKHRMAKWKKRELIIALDDSSVVALLSAKQAGDDKRISEQLWTQIRSLKLDSSL